MLRKTNKILAAVLCLALLCSLCVSALAAEYPSTGTTGYTVTVTPDVASLDTGSEQTVTVTITLSEAVEASAMGAEVVLPAGWTTRAAYCKVNVNNKYDEDNDTVSAGTVSAGYDENSGKISGGYNKGYGTNGAAYPLITGFTIKYTVPADAAAGEQTIGLQNLEIKKVGVNTGIQFASATATVTVNGSTPVTTDAVFAIESKTVTKGESVSVDVTLTSGDVAASVLAFAAENGSGAALQLTGITLGTGLDGVANPTAGKITFGSTTNLTAGAAIATLTFATGENTAAGDYTVYMTGQLANAGNTGVTFSTTGGVITVAVPTHTVTFVNEAGATVKEVTFTEGDTELNAADIPDVPEKAGYTGAWASYTLGNADLTVSPVYTAITYTVNFVADNSNVGSLNWTVEAPIVEANIPAVPAKDGFTGAWDKDATAIVLGDFGTGTSLTITAVYTAVPTHTVTFVNEAGATVKEVTFTEGDTELNAADIPDVPEKAGYTGAWASYTLGNADLTVSPVYTAITYTVNFVADNSNVGSLNWTVDAPIVEANIPAVPAKEGFTGAWDKDAAAIVLGDFGTGTSLTITAVYTAIPAVPGDIDGNGSVTVKDAQLLYSYLVDLYSGSDYTETDGVITCSTDSEFKFVLAQADVNGDGSIDVFDIIPLLTKISA